MQATVIARWLGPVAALAMLVAIGAPMLFGLPPAYIGPPDDDRSRCQTRERPGSAVIVELTGEGADPAAAWADAWGEVTGDRTPPPTPRLTAARCGQGVRVWGVPRSQDEATGWLAAAQRWVTAPADARAPTNDVAAATGPTMTEGSVDDRATMEGAGTDEVTADEHDADMDPPIPELLEAATQQVRSTLAATSAGELPDRDQLRHDRRELVDVVEALLGTDAPALGRDEGVDAAPDDDPATAPDDPAAAPDDDPAAAHDDDPATTPTAPDDDPATAPTARDDWQLTPPWPGFTRVLGGVLGAAIGLVIAIALPLLGELRRVSVRRTAAWSRGRRS